MDTRMAVAQRLRELIGQKGQTPSEAATSAGVPASTVYSILDGKSKNPGIVTLKMLCDGLGVSLTEFFDTELFRALEQEIR